MRLLNTRDQQIKEFLSHDIPAYAILSHTWGTEEASFQEMTNPTGPPSARAGFDKIVKACKVAFDKGYEWIWIDSCCIDKSSSAELTEAINSMYNWYKRAKVCLVYLEDLDEGRAFGSCRWFTRGWTLQELIAPKNMVFFDKHWTRKGTKKDLVDIIVERTGIHKRILLDDEPLTSVSVAQKMSWASGRHTTRIEDAAYCLLGIFGVHLSLRYGEELRAFRRLQEAIISSVPDLSIFAWRRDRPQTKGETGGPPGRPYCGVLATAPQDFAHSRSFVKRRPFARHELYSLNGAIMAKIQLLIEITTRGGYRYLLPLDCSYESESMSKTTLCVRLRKCGYNEFAREDPCLIVESTRPLLSPIVPSHRYLLPDITAQPWALSRPAISTLGFDPIGWGRNYAIQLQLPPGMWLHMLDIWPPHRFDGEDRVFYLTDNNTAHDSCMLRLRGGEISPHGDRIKVKFECVFFALGWSGGSLQCTVVDYAKFAPVLSEFRADACGWDFHTNYVLERLAFHGIPRTSEVVIQGKESRVRVGFGLERVFDGRVCNGEFWRAAFTCDELSGAEDGGLAESLEWEYEPA